MFVNKRKQIKRTVCKTRKNKEVTDRGGQEDVVEKNGGNAWRKKLKMTKNERTSHKNTVKWFSHVVHGEAVNDAKSCGTDCLFPSISKTDFWSRVNLAVRSLWFILNLNLERFSVHGN